MQKGTPMWNQLRYKLAVFMQGRCGADQFNRFLSGLALVLIILQIVLRRRIFYWLTLIVLIYLYFRMFSRNLGKRYQENMKYMEYAAKAKTFFGDVKYRITHAKELHERNRGFHIYSCPRCRQKIRIPKGKGNIMVRCPRCSFEFHKKS